MSGYARSGWSRPSSARPDGRREFPEAQDRRSTTTNARTAVSSRAKGIERTIVVASASRKVAALASPLRTTDTTPTIARLPWCTRTSRSSGRPAATRLAAGRGAGSVGSARAPQPSDGGEHDHEHSAGHADTAAGIVTGGMLVVVLAAIGRLRSSRAADRAGTATRLAAGRPDERDVRVHQGSLAIVGVVSVVLSGLASAATFLGVDATTIVRSMPFALLLTACLLYTSPSPRDGLLSRMPSSA